MGLGKTLTTLALIAWHLDAIDNARNAGSAQEPNVNRTTLIVTPKSSKSALGHSKICELEDIALMCRSNL